MRKAIRIFAGAALAVSMSLLAMVAVVGSGLAETFSVRSGETLSFEDGLPLQASSLRSGGVQSVAAVGSSYRAQLKLFGLIPVKEVSVQVVNGRTLVPCGTAFGVKLFSQGVMVVGLSEIESSEGKLSPAYKAGVRAGDIVRSIDGQQVNTNEEVNEIIRASGGKKLTLVITRNGNTFEAYLTPVRAVADGAYKAGMWVRDSTAGIGTMTYYDPESRIFAGLGHGITDVDTGNIFPLMAGEIVQAEIQSVVRGERGAPGELQGAFCNDQPLGTLFGNTDSGIFGQLTGQPACTHEALPVAMKQEVKTGKAQIYATIDGTQPELFEIEITKVNYKNNVPTKNMVIRITDERLLAATGGIVQGMSGSPIVQDGKLVGAVTHVFINDPTQGYAIFAENMVDTCNTVLSNAA